MIFREFLQLTEHLQTADRQTLWLSLQLAPTSLGFIRDPFDTLSHLGSNARPNIFGRGSDYFEVQACYLRRDILQTTKLEVIYTVLDESQVAAEHSSKAFLPEYGDTPRPVLGEILGLWRSLMANHKVIVAGTDVSMDIVNEKQRSPDIGKAYPFKRLTAPGTFTGREHFDVYVRSYLWPLQDTVSSEAQAVLDGAWMWLRSR